TSSTLDAGSRPSCAGLSFTPLASASPARPAPAMYRLRVGRASGSPGRAVCAAAGRAPAATASSDAIAVDKVRFVIMGDTSLEPAEYSRGSGMSIRDQDGLEGGGSSASLRPPPGITVSEFFARWLPEAFAACGRAGPANAPVVRASISGDGGGAG